MVMRPSMSQVQVPTSPPYCQVAHEQPSPNRPPVRLRLRSNGRNRAPVRRSIISPPLPASPGAKIMKPNSRRSASYQAGFTLVELMVGMGIGMLATVIILQVMSVFEAQRRTTTGTADAQTNGGIALYNITRELQMAGYPMLPVA